MIMMGKWSWSRGWSSWDRVLQLWAVPWTERALGSASKPNSKLYGWAVVVYRNIGDAEFPWELQAARPGTMSNFEKCGRSGAKPANPSPARGTPFRPAKNQKNLSKGRHSTVTPSLTAAAAPFCLKSFICHLHGWLCNCGNPETIAALFRWEGREQARNSGCQQQDQTSSCCELALEERCPSVLASKVLDGV